VKYWIPAYLVIDVATPQDAVRAKHAVEGLLNNPMVSAMLTSNGVPVQSITVADPTPVNGPQTVKR
jgi:hypothetical protein